MADPVSDRISFALAALQDPVLGASPYPSREEEERIRTWPGPFSKNRLLALFEYIRERWSLDYGSWAQETTEEGGVRLTLATGGWSGNENLLGALQENHLASSLCWESSYRGGRHTYVIPEIEE